MEGLWNGSSIFANALGLRFWGRFPVLLLLLLFGGDDVGCTALVNPSSRLAVGSPVTGAARDEALGETKRQLELRQMADELVMEKFRPGQSPSHPPRQSPTSQHCSLVSGASQLATPAARRFLMPKMT